MASELLHHGVGAAPTTPSGLTPARGTGTGLGSAGPRIGWLQVGGRHTRRRGVGRPGVHRSGSGRRPGRVVRDARMRTARGNAWEAICADRDRAHRREEVRALVAAASARLGW